jgi:pimeloyl-ACP methyl ester carboxylesterase
MSQRFRGYATHAKLKVVHVRRSQHLDRLGPPTQVRAQACALETSTVTVKGAELELISTPQTTKYAEDLPPILFLHGAAHGAWCWAEHYLTWFADRGCECHAVSFRGHVRSIHMPLFDPVIAREMFPSYSLPSFQIC